MSPALEPRGEPGGDVGGEHRLREQHGVVPLVAHELREHVDARLRQRRREALVVGDPDRRRADTRRASATARTPEPMTTPETSPPSCAAFESTPSEPFWIAPSWCSRKTSVFAIRRAASRRGTRRSARPRCRRPRSARLAARRRRVQRQHRRAGLRGAADVGRRQRVRRSSWRTGSARCRVTGGQFRVDNIDPQRGNPSARRLSYREPQTSSTELPFGRWGAQTVSCSAPLSATVTRRSLRCTAAQAAFAQLSAIPDVRTARIVTPRGDADDAAGAAAQACRCPKCARRFWA